MTAVQVQCMRCAGQGHLSVDAVCRDCDGIGRVWAPGAPSFGCSMTLADRIPGELVELGNGDIGRVLWHAPRPAKKVKVKAEVTYLGMIDGFDDTESHDPTRYPSCVGVARIIESRARVNEEHRGERGADRADPLQRKTSSLL